MKPYQVAVRALCEFTAKQGDLDLRFTPGPSAQEGIAGHAIVTARRGAGYQSEISLSGGCGQLLVRGRADGYDPSLNRLEEVKTHRGRLETLPANHRHLHWAQVKIYGALQCATLGLNEIELALVYFDIGSQQETLLIERHSAADLQVFFEAQCHRFTQWAEQELAHRAARDCGLSALTFPHSEFRTGQRPLATAVYRAAVAGRSLMAQAPTGIGKTIGTIFPLLKACPGQAIDKVFFLAAKTSGRALALDAVKLLKQHEPGLPLRTLELVARDKACEYPELACHGDSCPLANGFYDRLPQARSAAISLHSGMLDRAALRELALAHQVCPYYLSQEMSRWCDLVVGDYNYFFDLNAMLHGLTQSMQLRVALLVDEAHNLVERGRKMYSAELQQTSLRAVKTAAPSELKLPLARLQRNWNALNKAQSLPYQVYTALPAKLLTALQQACSAISQYLVDHPTQLHPAMQAFFFEALHFTRLAELFDEHALCDLSLEPAGLGRASSTLCIRNVIPAPFLKPRFAAAHSAVLFSATLQPGDFYLDMLGLPEDSVRVEVESPFEAAQLQVQVAAHISTRYAHRQASLPAINSLMAQQFESQPGNYLAFFSSHDYLQQAAEQFEVSYPQITLWKQTRRMSEAEQQEFLQRLTPQSCGIAFVVLGGSFAEGIDLPGKRLIGAFIATLGLPQVNKINEQLKLRIEKLMGSGYDYTYLFPGLQKVVQAAGRIIRSSSDEGSLYLMDDRYLRGEVRRLLPSWWQVKPAVAATNHAAPDSKAGPEPRLNWAP